MKVRIAYTVGATNKLRRGIAMFYGRSGLVGRSEVAQWFEVHGHSMNDDLAELADKPEAFCANCESPYPVIAWKETGEYLCRRCARLEVDKMIDAQSGEVEDDERRDREA